MYWTFLQLVLISSLFLEECALCEYISQLQVLLPPQEKLALVTEYLLLGMFVNLNQGSN